MIKNMVIGKKTRLAGNTGDVEGKNYFKSPRRCLFTNQSAAHVPVLPLIYRELKCNQCSGQRSPGAGKLGPHLFTGARTGLYWLNSTMNSFDP